MYGLMCRRAWEAVGAAPDGRQWHVWLGIGSRRAKQKPAVVALHCRYFAIRDETRTKAEGTSRAVCLIVDRRPPSRAAQSSIDASVMYFVGFWLLRHQLFSVRDLTAWEMEKGGLSTRLRARPLFCRGCRRGLNLAGSCRRHQHQEDQEDSRDHISSVTGQPAKPGWRGNS